MEVNKFTMFIFIAYLLIIECNGEKLSEMLWQPGDILSCKLEGAAGFFGIKHYMLGSDNSQHFISAQGENGLRSGDGYVVESHYDDFYGINKNKCTNHGKGTLSREETMRKARNSLGQKFTYNVLRCNCQHWVYYWANGSSGKWYQNQSLQATADYCAV